MTDITVGVNPNRQEEIRNFGKLKGKGGVRPLEGPLPAHPLHATRGFPFSDIPMYLSGKVPLRRGRPRRLRYSRAKARRPDGIQREGNYAVGGDGKSSSKYRRKKNPNEGVKRTTTRFGNFGERAFDAIQQLYPKSCMPNPMPPEGEWFFRFRACSEN